MNEYPLRTGNAELSDNELLIFDFLWWIHVPRHFLYSDVYSIHMNVAYEHSMSNEEVEDTLQRLLERKLIANRVDSPDSFTLTPAGGALWESERQPDWQTYVADHATHNEKRFACVVLDENIGRLFVAGMFAAGLIVPTNQIKCRTIYKHWLTPWKRVPTAELVRVQTRGQEPFQFTNWDVYQSGRDWWRDISELDAENRNRQITM
jgi:hypothetical protein